MKTGVLFKCQFATVSVEVTVMKKIFWIPSSYFSLHWDLLQHSSSQRLQ